jgi:trans-aconitate methyltransferase
MTRWLDQPSLIPILRALPEHDRGEFRQTVVTMMIQRTRQADGTCFETFRRINVWARK